MTPSSEAIEAAQTILDGQQAMHCNRVWSAWGYGTMTENDFSPVSDDDEAVMEIVEAILTAALPALERQIREQVARELADEATRLEQTKHLHNQDQTLADAMVLGVRHSAKLARGKDQP